MANALPASLVLPDPLTALPGLPIRAAQFGYLHECLNVATAELHIGQAVQQTWDDDVCSHAGATPVDGAMDPVPLARWRVPVPSDRHTALRIIVRAEADNLDDDAAIRFETVHAADALEQLLDESAIDDWTDLGLIDIDVDDDEPWEELRMLLDTDAGSTTATVAQVIALYEPLGSPLAAVSVSGAVPLGIGSAVAVDSPLPAVRGHQLIATVTALYARPRVVQAWSDLDSAYSGVHASQEGMPSHGVITVAPHGPGRAFHAELLVGDIAEDHAAEIRVKIERVGYRVAAEAADAETWLADDIDADRLEDARPEVELRARGPILKRTLLWDADVLEGPDWVRAFSIWGP